MKQKAMAQAARRMIWGATTAGISMTLTSLPAVVHAQATSSTDARATETRAETRPLQATTESVPLPPVNVQATNPGNTNHASTEIARLPDTLRDTPKTVTVISHELIEQQRATSLQQVLKNVPGITLSTGEGNGGQAGDQFKIRGMSAKGDIYVDGLRDFGAYKRDSFDTDSVQVIKGPSGDSFGVGSIGGLINQTTKKAKLETGVDIDQSIGSASTYRTTVDGNIKLGDTSAVRINGMYQNGNTPDRDHVRDNRAGVAVDFGTGIGTRTEWHLNYMYLNRNGKPDYGVPFAQGNDGLYRPLTEFNVPGIDSTTSYIRNTDRDKTNTHRVTSLFKTTLDNGWTLSNDTGFSYYDRDFASTNPAAVTNAGLQRLLAGNNVALSYGAGGGVAYLQHGWGVQNVTTAKKAFSLLGFENRLVFGLDMNYQHDHRDQGTWTGRINNQNVVYPAYNLPSGTTLSYPGTTRNANSADIGIFANDRIWLTKSVSLLGNLRWDYFRSSYWTTASNIGGSADAKRISPAIAAIWEPTQNTMFYTSFSRTYRPIGTDIALAVGGVQSEVPQNGANNTPERADTVELGTKLDLLDKRLGLTAAVFQTKKYNAYTVDPDTGTIASGFSDSGEGYQIRGSEIGITGKLTNNWSVNVAYAFLTGKVTYASAASSLGHMAPGVSHNNVSVWTSYVVPHALLPLPGRLTIGGGLTYASGYWVDSANTARMPYNLSLDSMIGYQQGRYRVSLNMYNLTDHLNYESAFSTSRAVPTSRRTFIVNVGMTF